MVIECYKCGELIERQFLIKAMCFECKRRTKLQKYKTKELVEKWPRERVESLYKQWLGGKKLKQLAFQCNVSVATIHFYFKKFGLVCNPQLRHLKQVECKRCGQLKETSSKNLYVKKGYCSMACQKKTPQEIKQFHHDRFIKRYYGNPKFRKYVIEHSKNYQKKYPEKARKHIKDYFTRLRKDPVRYQKYLLKARLRYHKKHQKPCQASQKVIIPHLVENFLKL